MMELRTIGSSSKGNCYVLKGENSCLILEAGITFKKVKPVIDFNIKSISGVLVSHSHGDHAKYVKDYLNCSVPVYALEDTISEIGIKNRNLKAITPRKKFEAGEFSVMPIALKHDVSCAGFVIKHKDMGVLLFATDTYYLPVKIKGMNHILIEANYDKNILDENIRNGSVHPIVRNRVLQSHMEINTVLDMLRANDLSKVRNILLLHLSENNSYPKEFLKKVIGQTGKRTRIAAPGLNISLSKTTF